MAKTNPQVLHNKKHIAHLEQVRRQTQAIKITSIVIVALVVILLAYGYLSENVFKQYRAVANVNGDRITVNDFQAAVKFQRVQLINRYSQYLQFAQMFGVQDPMNDQNFGPTLQQIVAQLSSTDSLGQGVLDSLIDERLVRQEAKRRSITVSQAEIDVKMQEIFGYYANGTPTPTLTATAFFTPTINPTALALVTITPIPTETLPATPTATATQDPLVTPTQTVAPTATATTGPTATAGPTSTPEPTATPYTLEGYKATLKESMDGLKTEIGLSEADYRNLFENMLFREKVQAAIIADLKPEEEMVWARHILVATEEEAKKVIERLNAGEDFGTLAKELSQDTGSAAVGGDLSWFGKGKMVAPFEESAFSLNVGEISQPVKSDIGYHIIQVLGHEMRPLTADEFQTYKDTFFTDFLKKLREDGKVETFDLWKTVVPTTPALPQQ